MISNLACLLYLVIGKYINYRTLSFSEFLIQIHLFLCLHIEAEKSTGEVEKEISISYGNKGNEVLCPTNIYSLKAFY